MKHYQIRQSITDRSSISVNLYLKEISKFPLLTPEKEIELIKLIKTGDVNAKNLLIKSNLRFVISIAKQYQNKGIDFADLIEYGNLGLIKAAEKFDETRGFKFISYAVWWIRQSILQALTEHGKTIRLPANQLILLNQINKFINNFEQVNERSPANDEIAEYFNIDENKVIEILNNNINITSLDTSLNESEETFVKDTIPLEEKNIFKHTELNQEINRILSELNPIEKTIIEQYFGINTSEQNINVIAEKFNLTKERIRQIKDKAILKLRKSDQLSKLAKYLGE